jgi:hypothetical protein
MMEVFSAIGIFLSWACVSGLLVYKWSRAVKHGFGGFEFFICLFLWPLVLVGAIIRQVFVEEWR